MNSGKDVDPDRPDAETVDVDTEPLERSQDAIDEGWDAAQEALKDNPPDPDESGPPEADA
jgi:hypothetical protein